MLTVLHGIADLAQAPDFIRRHTRAAVSRTESSTPMQLSVPPATLWLMWDGGQRGRRRRAYQRLLAMTLSLLAGPVSVAWAIAGATPASAAVEDDAGSTRPAVEAPLVGDDHPGLMERRRRDARDTALQGVLDGRLTPSAGRNVVELPGPIESAAADDLSTQSSTSAPVPTSFAELAVTGNERVLTLLVDFGPGDYRDRTWNGPVHRSSPPGSTTGARGSQPARYQQLLFGVDGSSLRTYVEDQSGGQYAIDGSVQDWVGVPYNAAYYGADDCGGVECPERMAALAADAVDAFVASFYLRNPTGDLSALLSPYDQRDRYDGDADGNFIEPDGYLDRLMIVFAGSAQSSTGEADLLSGGFASLAGDDIGSGGPAANPLGGHQLGSTGIWADGFSAVPEDADLGTLVHTFGHDLGLADLADPAGRADIDSSVQFWSPMAGGATLGAPSSRSQGAGRPLGVTVQPGAIAGGRFAPADPGAPDLLAVERLQLGWLDHREVRPGEAQRVELADATASSAVDAAVVPLGELPYLAQTVSPAVGRQAFVAATGANSRAVLQLPTTGAAASLSWRQWLDTEQVFDALEVQALVGPVWREVAPVASGRAGWTTRSVALPPGATAIRFVYSTDAVSTGTGVLLDEITIGTGPAEGAEAGIPTGWAASGWSAGPARTTARTAPGYYVVERRDLSGYDAALTSAPYVADPRRGSAAVDRFGYDDGVLVTFWDGRAPDNAVSSHAGSGRLLVVDARPEPVLTVSGAIAPAGLHPFDAAFGTSWRRGFALDAYAVTSSGAIRAERVRVRAQAPVPTFDDTDPRFAAMTAGQPLLPAVGVTMTVTTEGPTSTVVQFGPAEPS